MMIMALGLALLAPMVRADDMTDRLDEIENQLERIESQQRQQFYDNQYRWLWDRSAEHDHKKGKGH
jgi:hypothetical protein